jgi:hypothetical protein
VWSGSTPPVIDGLKRSDTDLGVPRPNQTSKVFRVGGFLRRDRGVLSVRLTSF